MSKRYFKIDTGRYGGETVVGSVARDFVEHWAERDKADLIEHVHNIDWGPEDLDFDSPDITDDGNVPWSELDDFEHITGPYSDNEFSVVEIELHPDAEIVYGEIQWKEGFDYGYDVEKYTEVSEEESHSYCDFVYGREAYSAPVTDPALLADYQPVLMVHSAEKGGFGELIVTTDGKDFEPEKLSIGVCETDVAEIIEAYWYDGVALEIDFNNADTIGKSMNAVVGYINPAWHDDATDYTIDSDTVKEHFEMLAHLH